MNDNELFYVQVDNWKKRTRNIEATFKTRGVSLSIFAKNNFCLWFLELCYGIYRDYAGLHANLNRVYLPRFRSK